MIRAFLFIGLVALAGCGDRREGNVNHGSTTPRYERARADGNLLTETVTPVRIGELGASFAACNAQGELRERTAAGAIPVRAAPFAPARETGRLPVGSSFFICSRSLDQQWLGVVFREGQADPACGVAAPVPTRRDYEGPCESGWVAATQVRLKSAVYNRADETSGNSVEVK